MRKHSMLAGFGAGLVLGFAAMSIAATTATSLGLSITIYNPLLVSASPAAPMVPCNTPAGTVAAAVATSAGDGNPVTLSFAGSADFALSGSDIVVGANGIAAADCPAAPGSRRRRPSRSPLSRNRGPTPNRRPRRRAAG